jgi:hypothetical protein
LQLLHLTRKLTEECCSAIETCRATVRQNQEQIRSLALPPSPVSPTAQPPAPGPVNAAAATAPPAPPPAPHPSAVKPTEKKQESPAAVPRTAEPESMWASFALLAVAVLLCPLLVLLLAGLLIRRTGLQFKVEVLNSSPAGPVVARLEPGWSIAPATPNQGSPAAGQQAVSESTVGEQPAEGAPFTGEHFDLGPSYEEEQQAKAQALQQQEAAVMQQIFEQNLRLQEEIAALEAEPEAADEGQPAEQEA